MAGRPAGTWPPWGRKGGEAYVLQPLLSVLETLLYPAA